MLTQENIIEILKKKNYNVPYNEIKKYANRTWLIQADYQRDFKTQPKLLLLDDVTGEVLIDINDYPKDLYGEEKFIQDFNKILIGREKNSIMKKIHHYAE